MGYSRTRKILNVCFQVIIGEKMLLQLFLILQIIIHLIPYHHRLKIYYKNGPEQKNIILIGNKKDMVDERQVTQEEAGLFSETNNMIYFETSAKDGDNIEYVFSYAAEKLLEFYCSQNEADLKKRIEQTNQLQSQNFKEIRIEEHKKNVVIYNEIYFIYKSEFFHLNNFL